MIRSGIVKSIVIAGLVAISSAASPEWIVGPEGIGPAKVGMTLSELNAALGEKFRIPSRPEDADCFYLKSTSHPHVSFMIEDGTLARIDVDAPGIHTFEGIQVGDLESHAREVYGTKLRVEPSHYGGPKDHYLTYQSPDHPYGIRFETTKGKITRFYAGRAEAIHYVEGCN